MSDNGYIGTPNPFVPSDPPLNAEAAAERLRRLLPPPTRQITIRKRGSRAEIWLQELNNLELALHATGRLLDFKVVEWEGKLWKVLE